MDRLPGNRQSVWMMVSATLIFGTIGIFRRYIPFSSAFLAFSRGVLGGLFLLCFRKLKKTGDGEKLPPGRLLLLILAGTFIGINWILLFEAYRYTTVAVATLCYYMQPTIVMLLSPLLFREKLTGQKMICAIAAVIGMILVSGVVGAGDRPAESFRGVWLGLGAAVFYSGVIILNKKIPGVNAFQKTTVQLFSAGMTMLPYLLLSGGSGDAEWTLSSVVLLLAVGIVHTGIAYVLYFRSMEGLSVQSIALLSYIDPVSALLFSALLLREPISALGIAGAILIIGSAAVSEFQKH